MVRVEMVFKPLTNGNYEEANVPAELYLQNESNLKVLLFLLMDAMPNSDS